MKNDSENKPLAPITLADIDELRSALGAAAEGGGAQPVAPPVRDTIMCPSSPWDQD